MGAATSTGLQLLRLTLSHITLLQPGDAMGLRACRRGAINPRHSRGISPFREPRSGSSCIIFTANAIFSLCFSWRRVLSNLLSSDSCGKEENSCLVADICAFLEVDQSRCTFSLC